MALAKDVFRFCSLRSWHSISGKGLVPAPRIDAEDAANIVTVTRYRKLAIGIAPFVEEISYRFPNLVLTVLGMVTGACDGINRLDRVGVFKKNTLQILDCFFGMKSMQVYVNLTVGVTIFVTLFIELTRGFAMSFSHEIVLTLPTKT
jgi:hypothetical protein